MGWRMRPVFRLLKLRFLTVQYYIFCFDLRLLALSIFWKFVQSFSLNHSLLLFDLIVICSFVTFYTVQSNSLLQIYFFNARFCFLSYNEVCSNLHQFSRTFEGYWSDEGCWDVSNCSDCNYTVCECNHLTNFAVLMSISGHAVRKVTVYEIR